MGVAAGFIVSGAFGPYVDSSLFNTPVSDRAAFGLERDPADILSSDPVLAGLRRLLLLVMSGLLTAAGTLVIAVDWFGLREGQVGAHRADGRGSGGDPVLVGRAPPIRSGWHPIHAAFTCPRSWASRRSSSLRRSWAVSGYGRPDSREISCAVRESVHR